MPQTASGWDLSYTQNRELSWLKFNARVLEEASDPTVPLMERLRFVSIFTSNLDEFFMVRVGSLLDLDAVMPQKRDNKSGKTPRQQLDLIFEAVRPLVRHRDAVYRQVMAELQDKGVADVAYNQLSKEEKQFVLDYYKDRIFPLLSPQIIDRNHPFPHLRNKALYAAALLQSQDRDLLGIVGVPYPIPPILLLPGQNGRYIRTEELLLAQVHKIFKIYRVVEQCVVSVTRNADINYMDRYEEDDSAPDFRNQMTQLLRQRERLAPVRLEMQGDTPQLRKLLQKMLRLPDSQVYHGLCPLSLGYAYQLNDCDKSLYNSPFTPCWPEYLSDQLPMWKQVRQRDVLLFYPYHTMQPFLNLLRESAADPRVVSIQMTIYRLARNSMVVKHLCAAAENGKNVTVLVELRARFDEKNNIEWARELEEAGCHVLYGAENYKCHSKICLITRQEKNGQLSHITQIGTGNYNEKTSGLYTDLSIMTMDPEIARDAVAFFQNMLIGNLSGSYEKLLVAPISMKSTLMRLIDGEIARGRQGHIIIKVNSITEQELIDKLSQASQAGVKIELIVRGICCLVPGVPGKTENITVTSIVGRFLEHSRVYCFGDGELRQLFISSADIMTRNQTRRVEIALPVKSPELRRWLSHYLDVLLSDNVKARRLLASGEYITVTPVDSQLRISSQQYFMEHPPELEATKLPRKTLWTLIRRRMTGTGTPFKK